MRADMPSQFRRPCNVEFQKSLESCNRLAMIKLTKLTSMCDNVPPSKHIAKKSNQISNHNCQPCVSMLFTA
eukprot:2671847-Amphidinium_carterae.2